MVGAWFTQYRACRSEFSINEDRFVKALAEFNFRKIHRDQALTNVDSNEGRKAFDKWASADSDYLLSEFKGKSLADVGLQMIRSFGNLAIYSNVTSFTISGGFMYIDYGEKRRTISEFGIRPPEPCQLPRASGSACPQSDSNAELADPFVRPSDQRLPPQVSILRRDIYDGPLTYVLLPALSIQPNNTCDLIGIVTRLFRDNDSVYRTEVNEIYGQILRDYGDTLALLALAQIKLPIVPAIENTVKNRNENP